MLGCVRLYGTISLHAGEYGFHLAGAHPAVSGRAAAVRVLLFKDRKTLFDPWNFKKNPRNAIDLLIYGLAGVSCCQFLYFLTIQLSTAGIATILQDLSPVLILLVLCLQQRRAPRLFELCSIVLALVGVFLLTTHGSLTSLAINPAALVTGIVCAGTVVIYTMWPKICRPSTLPPCSRAGLS